MGSDGLRWGVESICNNLAQLGVRIAPSTYYEQRSRQPSKREVRDEVLKAQVERIHAANYGVYGARKVWLALRREGIDVARCTVERLMAELGLTGAIRGKVKNTTIPDPGGSRPPDLVQRQFGPPAPNRLWVADLTYVSTWSGWAYAAFVIDAYARRILGWRVGATMNTAMVLDSIEQAIWTRQQEGIFDLKDVVHHTDRGSQGEFNWSSQHLDFLEVCSGIWEAAVRGSCVSGADSVAGAADGSVAGGQGQVLGGDRGWGDDRGRRGRSRRVVAGWVSLVPSCWRRESTVARSCFGSLPVLG